MRQEPARDADNTVETEAFYMRVTSFKKANIASGVMGCARCCAGDRLADVAAALIRRFVALNPLCARRAFGTSARVIWFQGERVFDLTADEFLETARNVLGWFGTPMIENPIEIQSLKKDQDVAMVTARIRDPFGMVVDVFMTLMRADHPWRIEHLVAWVPVSTRTRAAPKDAPWRNASR